MREFVITVNSTVDLPKEWLKERNVPVLPLKYTIDGQTYQDMEGLSAKEFFQKLREGHMSVTSQINPEEAREMMEPFLKEGKDLLHLAFSSGLSGTYNSPILLKNSPITIPAITLSGVLSIVGVFMLQASDRQSKVPARETARSVEYLPDPARLQRKRLTAANLRLLHKQQNKVV